MAITLPEAFADLQPFVEQWALPTEDGRRKARRRATSAEMRAFYDAMAVRIRDALALLDMFPVGAIPDSHKPLMFLAKAAAEIAPNVELYKFSPVIPHAFDEDRFLSAEGRR